ncbi:M23 family metallopeptidase [Rheinheimera sp. YQF-2]|uniref:M23 family metallopeptidase n=1 Tax=Rheinheimera lutimaris TaxID=2740584 RepID=A0A7Y5EIA3_9GAMM|nr:M23 family metallopeptidase [Rheinheimera lutimaris]NRQ43289.1 M23 family metallopeptidase [Rheinheimera lutimaris]
MKIKRYLLLLPALLLIAGFAMPERISMPVAGAVQRDWHPDSFWYEPWGSSGVHKGIDIFAHKGTAVTSTTTGIVLYQGEIAKGGKVVLVLGPKWRLHYFSHLNNINVTGFTAVRSGEVIGSVGDSGNAKGKPPHLHYSIVRLIPAPLAIDGSSQGYKKMFYIDPGNYLVGK